MYGVEIRTRKGKLRPEEYQEFDSDVEEDNDMSDIADKFRSSRKYDDSYYGEYEANSEEERRYPKMAKREEGNDARTSHDEGVDWGESRYRSRSRSTGRDNRHNPAHPPPPHSNPWDIAELPSSSSSNSYKNNRHGNPPTVDPRPRPDFSRKAQLEAPYQPVRHQDGHQLKPVTFKESSEWKNMVAEVKEANKAKDAAERGYNSIKGQLGLAGSQNAIELTRKIKALENDLLNARQRLSSDQYTIEEYKREVENRDAAIKNHEKKYNEERSARVKAENKVAPPEINQAVMYWKTRSEELESSNKTLKEKAEQFRGDLKKAQEKIQELRSALIQEQQKLVTKRDPDEGDVPIPSAGDKDGNFSQAAGSGAVGSDTIPHFKQEVDDGPVLWDVVDSDHFTVKNEEDFTNDDHFI